MKKIIVLFVLFFAANIFAQHDHSMHAKTDSAKTMNPMIHTGEIDVKLLDKNKDGKVFECPMDWNVISDEAGRCPVCEMKLKEYSVKDTESNLVKFGHHVKGHEMKEKMEHGMKEGHDKMKSKDDKKEKGSADGCKGDCCKKS